MAGASIDIAIDAVEGGKPSPVKFKIGFVSNWVMREARELERDMQDIVAEYEALLSGKKAPDELNEALVEKANTFLDRRYKIIEEILVTNGHKFDLDWWDKCTEPTQVNAFIYQATHKDHAEVKKKL